MAGHIQGVEDHILVVAVATGRNVQEEMVLVLMDKDLYRPLCCWVSNKG